MKFRLSLTAFVASLCLSCAAAAQPAVGDSPSVPPSPAALEQARHLIQTMHAERMTDRVIAGMETAMAAQIARNLPEAQREKQQDFTLAIFEEMRGLMPSLMNDMATIYATDFSEQELADMDRFYSSQTGQSVIAKLPMVTQQFIPVVMARMPALMGRAVERFCAKTGCTPGQRATFAKAIGAMTPKTAG